MRTPSHRDPQCRLAIAAGSAGLGQPLAQPPHAFGGRNERLIAQILSGTVDVEIVRRGELRRQKPGHGAAPARSAAVGTSLRARPHRQAAAAEIFRRTGGRPASPRIALIQSQHRTGSPLADEVRAARHGRAVREGIGRQQMGVGGVLDVHHVDQIRAVPHLPQATAPRRSIRRGTRCGSRGPQIRCGTQCTGEQSAAGRWRPAPLVRPAPWCADNGTASCRGYGADSSTPH